MQIFDNLLQGGASDVRETNHYKDKKKVLETTHTESEIWIAFGINGITPFLALAEISLDHDLYCLHLQSYAPFEKDFGAIGSD
jgi:predicted ferric reductase